MNPGDLHVLGFGRLEGHFGFGLASGHTSQYLILLRESALQESFAEAPAGYDIDEFGSDWLRIPTFPTVDVTPRAHLKHPAPSAPDALTQVH